MVPDGAVVRDAARAAPASDSAWSPLQHELFRALWLAALISNIGTWMQNVAGTWLMTSLTSSATLVALMQTATSLPVLLIGLPAGALADIVDRRRLLLVSQVWMLVAVTVLGVLTILDRSSPWTLLGLTFATGLGAALNGPAWQAILPELVPRSELPAAVALNGVTINLARAVGPALAGLLVATVGPGAVFLLNALTFLGTIWVLARWRRTPAVSVLPAERLVAAMRTGLRYTRHAPALTAVLVRAGAFVVGGSALLALLPLVARNEMGLGAAAYGVLLGALGIGAVVGIGLLPRVRRRVPIDWRVASATLAFAAATVMLAVVRDFVVLCGVMMVAGVAWIAVLSSLNAAAQLAAPAWVQGRTLAVYLLVFQGGMALGSMIWGAAAERVGIPLALIGAGASLVVGLGTAARWRLSAGEGLDVTAATYWSEPSLLVEPERDQGPVLITVEYRVAPDRMGDLASTIQALGDVRRRSGAMRWSLYFDPTDLGRCVETFVVESWMEHLRQHERTTASDQLVQAAVNAFHLGESAPLVTHLVFFTPGSAPDLSAISSGDGFAGPPADASDTRPRTNRRTP